MLSENYIKWPSFAKPVRRPSSNRRHCETRTVDSDERQKVFLTFFHDRDFLSAEAQTHVTCRGPQLASHNPPLHEDAPPSHPQPFPNGTESTGPIATRRGWALCDDSYKSSQDASRFLNILNHHVFSSIPTVSLVLPLLTSHTSFL